MAASDPPNSGNTLIPLPVAVDLIRFEKNLLQIGFFGAHDTRHRNESTRRIEQWVTREGQKTRVSAEFRGSGALGLPSTSDRDKYIAFMKIAMDQRAKVGRLENPIRFTGYQMLKELGLTYSGENYEDINRWGQRMADTTITSEQVIYLAARKKYANKTLHVFRSFLRAGKSSLDDTGRAEHYEVVLEDWLLENLNQSYVVPEDFNAYRQLTRPTAKGIFGYLHLWFHASQGRPVEKDYTELCMLLNIPVYKHVSKIRETMGRSLDELIEIGYLSVWDVRPMVTKHGFKLVLQAGRKLVHVLAISQRKSLAATTQAGPATAPEATLAQAQRQALQALLDRGIAPAKAESLVRHGDAAEILEQVEYAETLVRRDRRGRIANPAGFLIYAIENRLPVPPGFAASHAARERETPAARDRIRLEESYDEFLQTKVDEELSRRFPGPALEQQVQNVVSNRIRHDEAFRAMDDLSQRTVATEMLRREVRESGSLPSIEEWCEATAQMGLFGAGK